MSELFKKEANAQKENLKKYFRGSCKLPQAHEKVCDENETKNDARIKILLMKEALYKAYTKNWGNDLNKHQIRDSGHNEGAICLLNGSMGAKGMVFRAWAHKKVPFNSHWLVLRIGGTDFLHCWVTDSIYVVRTS